MYTIKIKIIQGLTLFYQMLQDFTTSKFCNFLMILLWGHFSGLFSANWSKFIIFNPSGIWNKCMVIRYEIIIIYDMYSGVIYKLTFYCPFHGKKKWFGRSKWSEFNECLQKEPTSWSMSFSLNSPVVITVIIDNIWSKLIFHCTIMYSLGQLVFVFKQ